MKMPPDQTRKKIFLQRQRFYRVVVNIKQTQIVDFPDRQHVAVLARGKVNRGASDRLAGPTRFIKIIITKKTFREVQSRSRVTFVLFLLEINASVLSTGTLRADNRRPVLSPTQHMRPHAETLVREILTFGLKLCVRRKICNKEQGYMPLCCAACHASTRHLTYYLIAFHDMLMQSKIFRPCQTSARWKKKVVILKETTISWFTCTTFTTGA